MSVSHLEQSVAALQNALVVAMEEVDQLRSQVFAETGKLHREFRETVDAVVRGASSTPRSNRMETLFEGTPRRGQAPDPAARLEYLELAVRALQERRDSVPAVDALMQQMKRWTETADGNARQLENRVLDGLNSSDQKLRLLVEERVGDAEAAIKRSVNARLDQQDVATRELDSKISALTTVVGHIDKRLHAVEEGLSQLDAEQHEVTSALQALREQQRRAAKSPTRRQNSADVEQIESLVTEQSAQLREELMSALDSKNQQRRSAPSSAVAATLEQRAAQQEVESLRQDLSRCVSHIERLMDDHQRISQQQHACMQTVQRVEHAIDGARDRLELDMKTELQRFDTLQKTFFSRQEQVLNSERHQLGVKINADLQRMHQKHMEELQRAEIRRLDDIRTAQNMLREEFNAFTTQQREEASQTQSSADERLRKTLDELKLYVTQEVAQQLDVTKKGTIAANDEARKVASRTMDELKRMKQLLEEQTNRSNDQSKFLHARVQQLLDSEIHRFDQIAFEFTSKLQKQVDEEVTRVVATHEGSISRDLDAHRDITSREIKNVKEELFSLRSSLQAIAAPSNALGSLDNRVDVLRRDVLDLHDAVGKVHDIEHRIQNNISQDTRILVESLKSDILRDVSQHIIRFDQALVELAQENAALKSRLATAEAEGSMRHYAQYSAQASASDAPLLPIGGGPHSSSRGGQFRVPANNGQNTSNVSSGRATPTSHIGPTVSDIHAGLSAASRLYETLSGSSNVPQTVNPSSVFGQQRTPGGQQFSHTQDLVTSGPRPPQSVFASAAARLESPERASAGYTQPLSRGAFSGTAAHREDPLVGVFSEASP